MKKAERHWGVKGFLFYIFCIQFVFVSWGSQTHIPAAYVGEDDQNGYRYEADGIGGISVNIAPEQTDSAVALITPDSGLHGVLYKNGMKSEVTQEQFIIEPGRYEYYFYPSSKSDPDYMGIFSFTLSGLQDMDEMDETLSFSVIENPEIQVTYDKNQNQYIHTLPNGSTFQLTVPSGSVSVNPVHVMFSNDIIIYGISRNGEYISVEEPYSFTQEGCYQIECTTGVSDIGQTNGTLYRFDVWFLIRKYTIQDMDIINAPNGFLVRQVWKNGMPVKIPQFEYLYLEEDGIYRILFEEKHRKCQYILECNIDREAPYLFFNKNFFDEKFYVPLSFTPSEEGCMIEIYQNGEKMPYISNSIEDGGIYRIVISDPYGNQRENSFFLLHNMKIIKPTRIILSTVFVLAIIIFMCYQRRHMRVL